MIRMTRRLTFSAALADWLPQLSRQENEDIFGPEASPEPYGHNYLLDVTVRGNIQPHTGIVVNIKEIDRIVKERVVQDFDRKFINRQVPEFFERPVTVESLACAIAARLQSALPAEARLSELRLAETALTWADWRAVSNVEREVAPTMLLTRAYDFAASHRLHSSHLTDEENRDLFGKCNRENGHGHNYALEVTVGGAVDSRSGRVLDPDVLDAVVHKAVVDRYDHRHLNLDVPEFADTIPSAEIIAKTIFERLRDEIPAPARLERVLLRETDRNFFEYRREDDEVR